MATFDPTKPATGSAIRSDELRDQLNALNDKLTGAFAALDWSNGAAKLREYSTVANPVTGNIAFDYANQRLMIYVNIDWVPVG